MRFLFPQFLWFLPLSLLPLLIHWIGSRMREKVPFPWISLLILTESEGRRWRRIYDLLLLLLRTALLFLLIVAFSRPVTNEEIPNVEEIYVDLSESMRVHGDAIKDKWKNLRRYFPNKPSFGFASGLKEEIEEPHWTHRATDFSLLQESKSENILLISDLQKTGLRTAASSKGNLYVLLFKPPKENVGISGVETDIPYRIPNVPTTLRVHLVHYGEGEAERSLRIKGAKENWETTVRLGPNERKTIESTLLLTGSSYQVELFPKDSIEGDDIWSGVLSKVSSQKVLLVGDDPDTRYLKEALAPPGARSPFRVDVRERIKDRSLLGDYSIVGILKAPSSSEMGYITEYINRGGAIVVFASGKDFLPFLNLLRVNGREVDSTVKFARMTGIEEELLKDISVEKPLFFDTGRPFLWASRGTLGVLLSKWKVALVGFKPSPSMTDLPFSPLMVPFSHRLFLLVLREEKGGNFKAGEAPSIPVEETGRYTLRTPSGERISLTSQIREGVPVIQLPPLEELGIYTLEDGTGKEIAVHLDPQESNPKQATIKEIQGLRDSVHILKGSILRGPRDLSRTFLLLALIFFAIEITALSFRRIRSRS